jgi:hypothetical protein
MNNLDVSKVTRVEVIDHKGRNYVMLNVVAIEFSLQDEDRTLKIFLDVETHDSAKATLGEKK